jgi:hypothetical protein
MFATTCKTPQQCSIPFAPNPPPKTGTSRCVAPFGNGTGCAVTSCYTKPTSAKDKDLVKDMERCPVDALRTNISNNWNRMNAAQFKAMDVDVVSARAEAQLRERTKKRFSVPGAWRQENLAGKATLRAIIDEGNWE